MSDITDLDAMSEKDLELLSIYMIVFADDIVLFTTDHVSLQAQLDSLYQYSCKQGLEINFNKRKKCKFKKTCENK